MEFLSLLNNDEIKNKMEEFGAFKGINQDEIICSIVYEFAKNLPYSIDYKDPKFVPGIFFNVSPENPVTYIFKDYNSLYNKMISWGDTLKSGILLQLCFVFQKMLSGEISSDYQLDEEYYYSLGINQMTNNEEYNYYLFEMLKSLPEYCKRVNRLDNIEDRRKVLDEVYSIMLQRIGQKIGGFRRTTIIGNVSSIEEHKATINLSPYRDLDMLYSFNNINYGYGIRTLIEEINQLKETENNLSIEESHGRK